MTQEDYTEFKRLEDQLEDDAQGIRKGYQATRKAILGEKQTENMQFVGTGQSNETGAQVLKFSRFHFEGNFETLELPLGYLFDPNWEIAASQAIQAERDHKLAIKQAKENARNVQEIELYQKLKAKYKDQ